MTTTRPLDLDQLRLEHGGHSPGQQMCVMEAVAFVAGEKWSDHPKCTSPVLGAMLRRLNDRLGDEDRQKLKPLILKLVGTNTGPEDEKRRALMAADYAIRVAVPVWMDDAGMTERAAALRSMPEITSLDQIGGMVPLLRTMRDEAWQRRKEVFEPFKAKFAEEFKKQLKAKGIKKAAAAAAADAAADAAAAAAAAADADAAAAAAADAAAAAAADADAWEKYGKKYGKNYWKIRNAVYEQIYGRWRDRVLEKVKTRNGERLDQVIALAERMAAVGRK